MKDVDRDQLRRRWKELWTRLKVPEARVPGLDALLEAYDHPSRAYHNLRHIEQCLCELDGVRALCNDADAVELAIWYHDAVYDATRHDNEEQSAELAAGAMRSAGLPQPKTDAVIALIRATKHDHPPTTGDAQILVDIDLSILGQPPEVFDAYERGIRKEYAHVEERAFCEGRAAILERFLERPALFSTPAMRERYELLARRNIARSLVQLRSEGRKNSTADDADDRG